MKFSRTATFFIGFLSVGLLAVATAVPVVKRQDLLTTVLDLVLSLVSTVLGLLGGLGGLTTASSLTPAISQITSVLDTATSSLSLANAATGATMKRATSDQNAQMVAQIVTDIATTLEPLTTNPNLPSLLSTITPADTSMKSFLDQANVASNGILPLAAQELTPDVISTLQQLQFTQTLADLGI